MARQNVQQLAFNRGLISRLALGRIDLKRAQFSAETMTNWMPRVLGSMMVRPGTQYLGASDGNNIAVYVPFIFSTDDTALVELTANKMRLWVSDALVSRGTVTAAVTNGTFDSDVASWVDGDEAGATSAWKAGGYLELLGDGTNYAIRDQEVTVNEANDEHALRVIIEQGPVLLQVGSSQGAHDYLNFTLDTGTHSLTFTPTGNFWIRFKNALSYPVLVDSVAVESAGVLEIPTDWDSTDIHNIKFEYCQSGDIIFTPCVGQQQRKVERRSTNSWSYVDYEANDGPFRVVNTTATTITPSALTGEVTLTASDNIFESEHVGSIFRVGSSGQFVEKNVTAQNVFTDEILVTGIEASRIFTIIVADRDAATITLQRSIGVSGNWEDVTTYVADTTVAYDDDLDNQDIYYRIGVKTGDYGAEAGELNLSLRYSSGSIDGVGRITAVASGTSATALAVNAFGELTASDDWSEGQWSDHRGWPSAGGFHEGRLFWAGKLKINGSVSDGFYSFDPNTIGDSGPINRSIGTGPVDTISWMLPGKTLLVGGQGAIFSARSSSFEEALTPDNFNLREVNTQGCLGIQAVRVDGIIIFAQRGGQRLYQIEYDTVAYDYTAIDLTAIVPEICDAGIHKIVVQRQPDTRIHVILDDGTVAILILDKTEEVKCWLKYETDGLVEDAAVLPGTEEDAVYYFVNRTIGGSTKRYLEKWAMESEARGATINKMADSFIEFTAGVATQTITGLDHLEGETVVAWANGKDLGIYTVAGGSITISEAATYAIVGLGYTADWKSTKLAYADEFGTSLTQTKNIDHLALIMADVHSQGLKFGPDFDTLTNMPMVKGGKTIDEDEIYTEFDEASFVFPGTWDTDARICLRGTAPRPCTAIAMVMSITTEEKV